MQGSAKAPPEAHGLDEHVARPLRHVPDSLHRQLKARAAMAGLPLSDYLIREVRKIASRAFAAEEQLHAPHLLDVEITQALRRLVKLKEVTEPRARQALDDFSAMFILRYAHGEFLLRIWQLRNSVTASDGVYVALSEALDAPLLTCDAKLGRSHGHRENIEVVVS